MKKLIIILAIAISGKVASQPFTVGSGNCLDFAANISNANHVDLGSLMAINTGDFSFECWMKVNSVFDDEAFFSNKNWASGNNTGFVFDVQDGGANMKFNFKDPSNARKDLTVPVKVLRMNWFHFAGTYKRGGYFKVYINGVAKDSLNVSSITGSFASTYTYKLGQDGTGNYTYNGANPRYNGKIDDVRIWTTVITQQQIRDNMCHKLTGNESNLYAYYNCDNITGTILNDLTPNFNLGTLVNCTNSNWTTSGAPIGNTSVNKYSGNFGSSTIQITNPTYGDFTIKNISSTAGIHLYNVTSQPSYTMGLVNLSGNNNYYGVFAADTNNTLSYDAEYNYTNYTTAMGDEANLRLFNRVKNDGLFWSDYFANQNITAHTLTKTYLNSRKEFIVGTKTGITCNAPTNLTLTNTSATTATVSWVTGGSSNWNIQWGQQGFALGNGTKITNSSNNPKAFTGLAGNTFYDVYVQDTCLGFGNSYWVGPFTFYGDVCLTPNALSATNITNNSAILTWNALSAATFDIEWGLPGFTPGTGIPVTGVANPYALTGLGANTAYSYFVRSVCGTSNNSSYNGPFTFTTTSTTTGLQEKNTSNFILIYPNPTNGLLTINMDQKNENVSITILNVIGDIVFEEIISNNSNSIKTIDLSNKAKGVYLINFKNGTNHTVKKIVLY